MPSRMDTVDLDEIYAFARTLADSAGQMLIAGMRKRQEGKGVMNSVEKENAVDVVTKTDEDIEAFIHSQIKQRYPDHDFIGEETYSKQSGSAKEYLIKDDVPTWCVDPLDGTVNYIHLFPTFCVSIAFILHGRPVVGVINAPFMNQSFHACTGKGAWLTTRLAGPGPGPGPGFESGPSPPTTNSTTDMRLPLLNNPIPPLPAAAPKGCIFSFEWGKDRRDKPDGNLHRKVNSFINMAAEIGGRDGKGGMVHGMRSLGSAALDIAYTAMGGTDIWWEGGCWEWDVAAGIAILNEAGALVTNGSPPDDWENAPIEEVKLGGRSYLAIRPTGPAENGDSGRKQQERLVREVWKRVNSLDYHRPGM